MLDFKNIKQLDYCIEDKILTVFLFKKVVHKGFLVSEIDYKMDYKMFLVKAKEWRSSLEINKALS